MPICSTILPLRRSDNAKLRSDKGQVCGPYFGANLDAPETERNPTQATCMALVFNTPVLAALPEADDSQGLAAYWKRYFNVSKEAGTEAEFVEDYGKLLNW